MHSATKNVVVPQEGVEPSSTRIVVFETNSRLWKRRCSQRISRWRCSEFIGSAEALGERSTLELQRHKFNTNLGRI